MRANGQTSPSFLFFCWVGPYSLFGRSDAYAATQGLLCRMVVFMVTVPSQSCVKVSLQTQGCWGGFISLSLLGQSGSAERQISGEDAIHESKVK